MIVTVSEIVKNISLIQCINSIVYNYTAKNDLISVYSDVKGFDFAYKQMDYSKKIISKFNPTKPELYLFENLEEYKLMNFLKGLRRRNITFNARAEYIFVQDDFDQTFLKLTLTSHLLNAIFVNSNSGEIGTYFPFISDSINNVNTELVRVGTCEDGKVHLEKNITDLFPKKIPDTWNNSTIRVCHHHHQVYSMCGSCKFQGIEIEIFDTISKRLGVNAVFYRVDTPPVAWRLFHEGVFDLFLINYIPIPFTDFTMSYIREVYFWFVPFPGITPRWSNIMTVFPHEVWLSLIPSAFLISTLWTIVSALAGKRVLSNFFRMIGFMTSLFLEQSRNVDAPKLIHRFLLFLALFLTFFINTIFKSRLTYLLNGLNYEKPVSSLEEAVSLQMFVGSIKDYVSMFNTSEEMARYLDDYLVLCDFDSLECANRTAFGRNMISMQSATKIIDAKSIFFDDKAGHWFLKPLPPAMHIKPIVASFQLGYPMFERYNTYLYRLVESGIVDKISRRYYDEKALKTTEPSLAATDRLQLDNVVAPGVLWIVGVFLSIILFLLERKHLLDAVHPKKDKESVHNLVLPRKS